MANVEKHKNFISSNYEKGNGAVFWKDAKKCF